MNEELIDKIIDKVKTIFKYDSNFEQINQIDTAIEVSYKVSNILNVGTKQIEKQYHLTKIVFSNKDLYIGVSESSILVRNFITGNFEKKMLYDGWDELLEV